MHVPEPTSFAEAFAAADWESLLPRLAAYAETRLRRAGWSEGRDTEPSATSVQDVVNLAIEHCLSGHRSWTPAAATNLCGVLCGVISSLVSSQRKGARRDKATASPDAGYDQVDDGLAPDEQLAERDRSVVLEAVAKCVEDDEQLSALTLAILEGNLKREDLAEALGWSVDTVSASKTKLQRRLMSGFREQFAKFKQKRKQ